MLKWCKLFGDGFVMPLVYCRARLATNGTEPAPAAQTRESDIAVPTTLVMAHRSDVEGEEDTERPPLADEFVDVRI